MRADFIDNNESIIRNHPDTDAARIALDNLDQVYTFCEAVVKANQDAASVRECRAILNRLDRLYVDFQKYNLI